MGFNYRRRIKICKGVHINVGKKGISTSYKIGNVTVNPKRNRITARTPIKGLSYTTTITNKNNNTTKVKRKRSKLFDFFMFNATGGLWTIWMLIRPKDK